MTIIELNKPTSEEMLNWQLTMLYAQLQLLGDHAGDHERCACEKNDETGEFCIAKHLTAIAEGYCTETIPMTGNGGLKQTLSQIRNGATDLRREYLKAMTAGKEPAYNDIAGFARDARKELEPYLWKYKSEPAPALFSNICTGNSCIHLEMPAPFGWVGGKRQLSKTIVSLIPPHKTYVEPFAGAAWVFWAKEPSEVEVLNDLDPDLMRFYRSIGSIADTKCCSLG